MQVIRDQKNTSLDSEPSFLTIEIESQNGEFVLSNPPSEIKQVIQAIYSQVIDYCGIFEKPEEDKYLWKISPNEVDVAQKL